MIGLSRPSGLMGFQSTAGGHKSAEKATAAQSVFPSRLSRLGSVHPVVYRPATPRNTLPPLNGFKVSTQVPAPLNPEEASALIKRLKPLLPDVAASGLPSDELAAQKVLYLAGSRIVREARRSDDHEQIPVGLAVYQEQGGQPKLLKIISLPTASILTQATQPVSQAAYGISLLRADLPRHLPPAFITKFLEPVWQFFSRKDDKGLYPPNAELRYLRTMLKPKQQAKQVPGGTLEFSNQDYDELLLNAHAVPLGLRTMDEPARTNYGHQIFRMWRDIVDAMESQAVFSVSKAACKLGTICLNAQTGEVEYRDISNQLVEMFQETSPESSSSGQDDQNTER